MVSIVTRPVGNGETEFDFLHPKTKKRVRRKIKAEPHIIEKVVKVLENLFEEQNISKTSKELEEQIRSDILFNKFDADEILRVCDILYFNYVAEEDYTDQEIEATNILNGIFTEKPDIAITFLGKTGVGKSSIINKMSWFADKSNVINFPFVDTSRTTVFAAEYDFIPVTTAYRCVIVFLPDDIIELRVDECIERAVYKALELQLKPDVNSDESSQDKIISAFYSDPSQLFDIRLCLGKHIKTTSKNYELSDNADIVERWETILKKCIEIAKIVVGEFPSPDAALQYYQERFTNIIKLEDEDPAYNIYTCLKEYIKSELLITKSRVFKEIEKNKAVTNFSNNSKYLMCKVNYHTIEDFSAFISMFTSKAIQVFGNSLLPLVYKLKIEIPYNELLSENIRSLRICCIDTVGVAHTTETSGGFERSTNLSMGKIDAVIIADDSRVNMDTNTGIVLKHIISRVDCKKVYFALTFFETFNKAQFDPTEDIEEQKIDYLTNIQIEKVAEYLERSEDAKLLNDRIKSKKNTFYLKGLAQNDKPDIDVLNNLLERIRQDTEMARNISGVSRIDRNKSIVAYDYKKLALLYAKAHKAFYSGQHAIYMQDYPHFKTTEALTKRLSIGETFFNGAKKLKPVDDFYDAIIKELNDFIVRPQHINLTSDDQSRVDQVLALIKTEITERIRTLVLERFFSKTNLNEWRKLYIDGGMNVDARRREGIISLMGEIAPDETSFLLETKEFHIINTLEDIFEKSILSITKKLGF